MDDQRKIEIEGKLSVFSTAMIQDFFTFQNVLEINGISLEDVSGILERRHLDIVKGNIDRLQLRKKREKIINQKMPKCKVCGLPLRIESINNSNCRKIDDHSKSWLVCPDKFCENEPILSDKFPHELLSSLGLPVYSAKKRVKQNPVRNKKIGGCKETKRI